VTPMNIIIILVFDYLIIYSFVIDEKRFFLSNLSE